ncbi:ATP-binding protein [Rhodospirillaceae bacterium SYSU D60014]|uniref:Lon protease family protein n=1 Tax=Virgifigura deserti TaxID=2268457 RepID=UPI000E675243
MPAKKLTVAEVGLPRFEAGPCEGADIFGLSSHWRAREALEIGLSIDEPGFNVFVLGEDRSGRMSATVAFLEQAVARRPQPNDWVYLNNFRRPHRPRPYRLPAGVGRRFRDRMAALVPQIREALVQAFGSEAVQKQIGTKREAAQSEVALRLEALRAEASRHGLDLAQAPQGGMAIVARSDESGDTATAPAAVDEEARRRIAEQLAEINRWAAARQIAFTEWARTFEREIAEQATDALLDALVGEFSSYAGLARWLTEMRIDILDNLERFRPKPDDQSAATAEPPERRYAVNLLVDHSDDPHPSVVVEANPSYEALFGRIDYEQANGALRTNFALIRAGSLHRANGGVLVLRAEALANDARLWSSLKAALRDREIRVEEPYRAGAMPIAGAPRPKPIPLDVKIVIVGAPRWYYTFFSADPDFQIHFKIKADIDTDMDATPQNLACYAALIRRMAAAHQNATCEEGALRRLLGISARWAARRDKLTAQFERLEDLIGEALLLQGGARSAVLSEQAVIDAMRARRQRNARVEDRLHENIARGMVMIDTVGAVVGQVNALTVRDLGDHAFGAPTRVTARASVGRLGVINVERDTTLGGPIQQKGVMVLQGFLAGHFARRIPLSFNCSITFEQSYGGVEGDSASIAELLAILSDLAGVPLRQDLAITGSVNQRGQAQAVGGIHHKIEGFFRCCVDAGGLSGTQGVAIPAANEADLILRDEITEAVAAGRFHIWSIATIEEAIELFTGRPAGERDADGGYPPDSVYGRVAAELTTFDRILAERIQV